MPASPVALARPGRRIRQRGDVVLTVVVVVAASILIAWVSVLLADPDRVDLVIENPTSYYVHVGVRPVEGEGRLGLGTVEPGTSMPFFEVLDQGDRWLFDYSLGGVDAPPVEVSREELSSGAVEIPESVEELFRDAGLLPPLPR